VLMMRIDQQDLLSDFAAVIFCIHKSNPLSFPPHTNSTLIRFPTATPYRRSVSPDGDTRPPCSRAMADRVVPIRSASAACESPASLRARISSKVT
jgi:hypothetical protein